MNEHPYRIQRRQDGRYLIVDPTTGAVLDDAQGFGYTAADKAAKAAWYKFKGGKTQIDATKKEARAFWRQNKAFAQRVDELSELSLKEVARGEVDFDAAVAELAAELGIVGFEPRFVRYCPEDR